MGSSGRRDQDNGLHFWSQNAADRAPNVPGSQFRWLCPLSTADLVTEPHQRIVLAADDSLFERDQSIVGDLDLLRADLGAALGDVAVAQAVLLLRRQLAVDAGLCRGVQRVHVQL